MICGPTAVGKTALSIELAKHYDTEILSADSRQFYREMTIGTAKPDEAELAAVPHHFINNLSINDTYTAGDYEREALRVLDKIFAAKDVAVMVGGSGLFIKAVCEGFDDFQKQTGDADTAIISKIKEMSLEKMQIEVAKLDPAYYEKVDRKNPRRLQRALEVIYTTGKKYSEQRSGIKAQRSFNIIKIGLELPREKLYERINLRVDAMMAAGQWQEAEALYPYRHLQPLQTVGYQEIFDSIDGKLLKAEAVEKIKQNTRNYAKRQMTWFKKDEETIWVEAKRSDKHDSHFVFSSGLAAISAIQFLDFQIRNSSRVFEGHKAHSWDQIEQTYTDFISLDVNLEKMLDLVKHIKATGLSDRLFGLTSLWRLILSTEERFGVAADTLSICIEGELLSMLSSGDIERKSEYKCIFQYSSRSKEKQIHLECYLDNIIETFEAIVLEIGWKGKP